MIYPDIKTQTQFLGVLHVLFSLPHIFDCFLRKSSKIDKNSAKNFGCDNLPTSDHRKNLKNDPIDLIFLC